MAFSFIILLVQFTIVYTLQYLKKYRDNIINKHVLLNKIIPSITILKLMIISNKIGVALNITTIGIGLHFLYMNPFEVF